MAAFMTLAESLSARIKMEILQQAAQITYQLDKKSPKMWPFGSSDKITVENNISTHEVISYAIDGGFVLLAIIIIYKWRRHIQRLWNLESAERMRQLTQV